MNDALRRGFAIPLPATLPPFKLEAVSLHLPPEIGYGKLNQYYDDLEVEAYLAKRNREELAWQAGQLKSASQGSIGPEVS